MDIENWKRFAEYQEDSGIVIFNLQDELEPGLHYATATLSDGSAQVEYQLYVYVHEAIIDQTEDESVVESGVQDEQGVQEGDEKEDIIEEDDRE